MLASFAPNVYAFAPEQFPFHTAGNLTTFGTGTVGGGTLGSGTVSFASDGTLLSKGPVSFAGGAGSKVAGQMTATVSKAAAAAAIGRFAMKAVPGALLLLSTVELARELGFSLGKNPLTDAPEITKTVPVLSDYYFISDWGSATRFGSGQAACDAWVADHFRYSDPRDVAKNVVYRGGTINGDCYPNGGTSLFGVNIQRASATGGRPDVATEQEFVDAIAAKSGWPTSSSYGRAFQAALDSGEVVVAEPVSITGPATVTQPPSVVTTVIPPLPSVTDTSLVPSVYIGTGQIGNGYRDVRVEGVTPFAGGSMVSLPTNSVTVSTPNPGSVPATSTLVTTRNYPGGTVETTTTTTTELIYAGPTVSATDNTTNKTTVKDAAGNVIAATTSKQTPGTTAAPASSPAPDSFDLCKTYPDIAACAKLDKVEATPIKNKDISVSITPDSGWGPASGTCPAPRVLALHGLTTEFSWQPMCDFASGIRGVILAVAWLIAAGSVIGMARKE